MTTLSLGLGTQSTALYYKSSIGEIARADYACFVDLGREGCKTYDYLYRVLLPWQKANNGIPIIIRRKNLYKDLLNKKEGRFASIPAFTYTDDKTGMLRRQCTSEYKIGEVNKAIREIYELRPKQRTPATSVYLGISLDERDRASIPQEKWKTHIYPFLKRSVNSKGSYDLADGELMSRQDIYNWYNKNKLEIPPKSACVFCPYQSDKKWLEMKRNEPKDFAAAIKVDKAIRNSSMKGINSPIYLHKSCKPLTEVNFNELQGEIDFGECSGNCHI